MPATLRTDWLRPALAIKGQDPLGVRAPCENIYSQLLPGITNVTDRADLYAFYPWLIWAFERYEGKLKKKPFFETLRRAECLQTLVGVWHTWHTGEDLWLHGGGLVGRDRLGPAFEELEQGKTLRLSTFATTEDGNKNRYFKNKLGGLGQYYLGSLTDLGIVDGNAIEIKYVTERGGILAAAFDQKVNRKLFFDTLEQDRTGIEDLKALRRFCPCYLNSVKSEHGVLTELFFNDGRFHEDSMNQRASTLHLILDLMSQLDPKDKPADKSDVEIFRACVYSGALPSGDEWTMRPALERVRAGWRTYQRNELLSIAVQGIFWAGLSELFRQGYLPISSEEYRGWFLRTFDGERLNIDTKETLSSALERTKQTMPARGAWSQSNHEMQIGWRLADVKNSFKSEGREADVIAAALNLTLLLASRTDTAESSYVGFVQHRNYLTFYPINLDSFAYQVRHSWQRLSVGEVLGWLATDWGVSAHLRVALRKLRYESRDTFKIKPTERGLEVVDAPLPAFSNPRLVQANRMLRDLRALEMTDEGLVITEGGKNLLEDLH